MYSDRKPRYTPAIMAALPARLPACSVRHFHDVCSSVPIPQVGYFLPSGRTGHLSGHRHQHDTNGHWARLTSLPQGLLGPTPPRLPPSFCRNRRHRPQSPRRPHVLILSSPSTHVLDPLLALDTRPRSSPRPLSRPPSCPPSRRPQRQRGRESVSVTAPRYSTALDACPFVLPASGDQ